MNLKKPCGDNALRLVFRITILIIFVGTANAENLTVCPDGCEYSSIQKAINAAGNGDHIFVTGSTYFENVNITKQLILRGIDNPVVDAEGKGSAFTLSADGITLEGFTVTQSGINNRCESKEMGIKVISRNNILINNNASNNYCGGIHLYSSINNILSSNDVSNNKMTGIFLLNSSNNTLNSNNVSNNEMSGISLSSSNNNILSGNNVSNHRIFGISLQSSLNTTLTGNNVSNNYINGISLISSRGNMLSCNNVSNNYINGISLTSSGGNMLSCNNVSKNRESGIILFNSSNNILTENNADLNNNNGIFIRYSRNNTLSGNIMTKNQYNFILNGHDESDFINHIDKGNLVDGKPIYYLKRVSDTSYGSSTNAGTVYCISCANVTISDLDLNKNSYGIFFWNTSQSKIQNVTASNNYAGIVLHSSSNNTLTSNNVSFNRNIYYDDTRAGIYIFSSNNNTLKENNALNNDVGISLSFSSKNVLIDNKMNENYHNFDLNANSYSDFDNQIDTTNLVEDKPVFFLKAVKDAVYDSTSNAGIFYCISCVNVTLKNVDLINGLFFWNTTGSKIKNVTILDNNEINQIYLSSSSSNRLIKNKGSISLSRSSSNTVSKNKGGISLSRSNKNTLYKNKGGISLSRSSNNIMNKNNGGIYLLKAHNNILKGNNALNIHDGISLHFSSNNTIVGNKASNNYEKGIFLSSSDNNTITKNDASYNSVGIALDSSRNKNRIYGNNISFNYVSGISLYDNSKTNIIYNNFFNNTNNFNFYDMKINTWNTTMRSGINIIHGPKLGGNFWANPDGTGFSQTCQDMDGNGICDQKYILDARNIDFLPLSINFTKAVIFYMGKTLLTAW